MTEYTFTASRFRRRMLEEIAQFHRAQQLASGDTLSTRIREIERTVHRSAYASAVWELGDECRHFVQRYKDYIQCFDLYRDELKPELDAFTDVLAKISIACEEIGLEDIRRILQQQLNDLAETGALRREQHHLIAATIHNPAVRAWGDPLIADEVKTKVIPQLNFPDGFVPRYLLLVQVQTSQFSNSVAVTVNVGEKIQG